MSSFLPVDVKLALGAGFSLREPLREQDDLLDVLFRSHIVKVKLVRSKNNFSPVNVKLALGARFSLNEPLGEQDDLLVILFRSHIVPVK